jgi:uncharacterized protein
VPKIAKRLLDLRLPAGRSAFLWGPRKTGKSHWLKATFPNRPVLDLLKTDVFVDYATRPALLRERFQDREGLVIIDEVQKVPSLLDEVHWLIENRKLSFLLTGSSARRLRRGHANLLGGRAWRRTMVPLSYREVSGFDLAAAMVSGMIPPHFLSPAPREDLRAYTADYRKEEIAAEADVRDLPAFAEFLRVAALTSSELLNYANIAREAGVSQKAVREYFQILEDTYLASRLGAWKKSRTRRMIQTEKFYFFDVGVANHLSGRRPEPGNPDFGKAFEHFILMELRAYQAYKNPDLPLAFWRSAAGQEVDFIVGEKDLAIEVKGARRVQDRDLVGLRALGEDGKVGASVVVGLETEPRRVDGGIQILPWKVFLDRLWDGDLL